MPDGENPAAVARRLFLLKVERLHMTATIELRVLNALGLHARPASGFVRCALKFKGTTITLRKGDQTFAATSILEVLTAELDQGAVFTVEADGPDADTAVQELAALMIRICDEEEAGNH